MATLALERVLTEQPNYSRASASLQLVKMMERRLKIQQIQSVCLSHSLMVEVLSVQQQQSVGDEEAQMEHVHISDGSAVGCQLQHIHI